jgi:integrase
LAELDRLDGDDPDQLQDFMELLTACEQEALRLALYDRDERQRQQRQFEWRGQAKALAEALAARGVLGGPSKGQPSSTNAPALAELVTRFLALKQHSAATSTIIAYEPILSLFVKIVSELGELAAIHRPLSTTDLAPDLMRGYRDTILAYPRNFRGHERLTIRAILARKLPALAPKTVLQHLGVVRTFLRWIESERYALEANLYRIFASTSPGTKGERVAFTGDDLKKLFETDEYRLGTFERPSDFWLPLLALFTGARASELCQLHSGDVYKEEAAQIWVIDINNAADKQLKTGRAGCRRVPIHKQLIRLGWLDFVAWRQGRGDTRLFPEEERNAKGEFASFSKRFNRYKRRQQVDGSERQRKDFHSFRHTVSSQLIGSGCHEYIANQILGHVGRQSETVRTYSQGAHLRELARAVESLSYPLDWAQICKCPRWDLPKLRRKKPA